MTRKALEVHDRNLRIVQMVTGGYGLQVVADQFGLSRGRISQIVSEYHSEVQDDSARDLQQSQLEGYLTDTLHPMLRGPGKPLFANGSGKLVYDENGDIVYDEYAKIDVVNSALRVHERLAKLKALDRPKPKEKDESGEINEAMAYVKTLGAEVITLRAKLAQYEVLGIEDAEIVDEDNPV